MRHSILALSVFITVTGSLANVETTAKTEGFPDRMTATGSTLVKNGEGKRTATIFNVEVYKAALYLAEKTNDAGKILSSKTPKRLEMKDRKSVV